MFEYDLNLKRYLRKNMSYVILVINYAELQKVIDYVIIDLEAFCFTIFKITGGKNMHNVFVKKNTEEQYIQLSDGRMMPLEKLVRDYERLLKKKSLKKVNTSKPKDNKSTVSKLKVGEWFRIDREIISNSENEIRCKCNEAGSLGVEYWKRFYASNVIANENPCQYPRLIETYVFEHSWKKKDAQEIEDMCKKVGEGICDEVICDLELQMRICNGEWC